MFSLFRNLLKSTDHCWNLLSVLLSPLVSRGYLPKYTYYTCKFLAVHVFQSDSIRPGMNGWCYNTINVTILLHCHRKHWIVSQVDGFNSCETLQHAVDLRIFRRQDAMWGRFNLPKGSCSSVAAAVNFQSAQCGRFGANSDKIRHHTPLGVQN